MELGADECLLTMGEQLECMLVGLVQSPPQPLHNAPWKMCSLLGVNGDQCCSRCGLVQQLHVAHSDLFANINMLTWICVTCLLALAVYTCIDGPAPASKALQQGLLVATPSKGGPVCACPLVPEVSNSCQVR